MLSGKLGKLLVQSYQQPFAKLFILLERLNLPEKLVLPFTDQIKLQALELLVLLRTLKLAELLKSQKLKTRFLNQIKKRLKRLKLKMLKFELLQKMKRLPVKLFLLTKLELLLLMKQELILLKMPLLNLPN